MVVSHSLSEDFIKYAFTLFHDAQHWKQESHNDKVICFVNPSVRMQTGETAHGIKVQSNITIPYTSLIRVVREVEHQKEYDAETTDKAQRIPLSATEDLIYSLSKSPNRFLVAPRDFVSIRKMLQEVDPSTQKPVTHFITRYAEDDRFPITKGIARGRQLVQVMRIEEMNDNECKVETFSCLDIGGSIPSLFNPLISKKFVSSVTHNLYKGYDFLKKQ